MVLYESFFMRIIRTNKESNEDLKEIDSQRGTDCPHQKRKSTFFGLVMRRRKSENIETVGIVGGEKRQSETKGEAGQFDSKA